MGTALQRVGFSFPQVNQLATLPGDRHDPGANRGIDNPMQRFGDWLATGP